MEPLAAVDQRLPIVCRSGKICKWHFQEPRRAGTDQPPFLDPRTGEHVLGLVAGHRSAVRIHAAVGGALSSRGVPHSQCPREFALDVQHVGSTAVPGLKAKPILDIAVAIPAHAVVPRCATSLAGLGYEYAYWVDLENDFTFEKGIERTHHVHLVELDSRQWSDYLRFRDALRQNAQLRANTSASRSSLVRGSAAIVRPTRARRPNSSAACFP